jgi:hypothetical protein
MREFVDKNVLRTDAEINEYLTILRFLTIQDVAYENALSVGR